MYEQQTPHLILKHEYLCDSAGAGKWRGGLGTETIIKIGADHTKMVVFGDGDVKPAYGLKQGKESILNIIELRYPNRKRQRPFSKDIIDDIPKNTIYYQVAGGGGGYGNPKDRPKEKVIEDVKNEVLSKKMAKEVYKVKI